MGARCGHLTVLFSSREFFFKEEGAMKFNRSTLMGFCLSCIFMVVFSPCLSSADPLDDWLPADSGTLNLLYGATYGIDTFISAGNSGTILVSSDGGTTWSLSSNSDTHHLYGIEIGRASCRERVYLRV